MPVNARMTAPELARIAAHADPRLTVYLSNVSPPAAGHASDAAAAPWATPLGPLHITDARRASAAEAVRTDPGQTAVILYTTGTTGTGRPSAFASSNTRAI